MNPVHLLKGQAHKENRERRNRFYERYGIEFDYEDHDHSEGISKPMIARDLMPVMSWEQNIEEVGVMEYMAELLRTNEMIGADLSARNRAVKWLSDDIQQMKAKPFRWATAFWLRHNALKAVIFALLCALATYMAITTNMGKAGIDTSHSHSHSENQAETARQSG